MTERVGIGPSQREVFRRYLTSAHIFSVAIDEIPPSIVEHFEGRSGLFIHPSHYKPRNFEQFYLITHTDGSITYSARQTKTYEANNSTEELTYLVDVNKDGIRVGHGEVRRNISDDDVWFKDKPFVGYTITYDGYERQGLGTRRLLMMNAISEMLYGLPLNSSTTISKRAESLWKRQVESGRAKAYMEGSRVRYVFI